MKAHFAPTIRKPFRSYKRVGTFLAAFVVCATLTAVFFYVSSRADAGLFLEDFSYTAGTALTVNGWTAHSAGGTNPITVVNPGLTFAGYPASGIGNAASMAATGEDDSRTFPSQTAGTVYAAFMVNVSTSQTTGDYFFHLAETSGGSGIFRGRVFVKKDPSTTNFAIGISKLGTTAGVISYSGFTFAPGTTNLLVVKYTFVAGATNDTVDLFINPTPGGVEPAPTLSAPPDAASPDALNIAAVALRQGAAANSSTQIVDGIRIADTWARATSIVSLAVAMPHVTGPTTTVITVPISVGDLTGEQVKAYDLQVTFNAAVVQPDATPTDTSGTVSSGMAITTNAGNSGHLIISAFQTNDLTGSGTLIKLRFMIVGAPGQFTPTTFQDYTDLGMIFHPGCRFNAGTPACVPTNGSIHVNGPTAAAARISGQIVTPDGQPLGGATVTVMGGAGTIRTITDGNGFYQVENLEVGEFYTVTPSRANFVFAPANRSFSLVGNKTDAVFTGMPINPEGNPLESPEFFVRQQYLDFLSREPDQGGLEYWSAQLRSCGNDAYCIETRRLDISAAFFIAQEFRDSGLFIYDLYEGALGRRPDYSEYSADRGSVVGGPNLEADKTAFAESFVARAEFNAQYPLTMSDEVFVDALLRTAQQSSGIDLGSDRAALINLYNTGATATESRSLVVRSVAEDSRFRQTQYNPAFVLMEYYGYLGRNPDGEGYDFWLTVLNSGDGNNYRGMVCSFITSAEYQHRFSSVVTRGNAECGRIAPPVGRPQ
jgi:hypothetical protein